MVVDGDLRADGFAAPALDAFVGLDVEHPVALVDAVCRALFHAGLVHDVDAGVGDDVRHALVALHTIVRNRMMAAPAPRGSRPTRSPTPPPMTSGSAEERAVASRLGPQNG
ncbi:hypothetical protein GCM10018966_001190 [Streptomyces yanii]